MARRMSLASICRRWGEKCWREQDTARLRAVPCHPEWGYLAVI
jgi:hypothetical protein